MPDQPETQQLLLSGLLVLVFFLLMTERLRIDVTAAIVIVALPLLGLLEPEQAFSGFSSEPAIVVAAVFILSGAIYQTGLSNRIGGWITHVAGTGSTRIAAVLMLWVAGMSAFTHHLTITAISLPVALKLCQDHDISPSRLLMPVSFASSLGTTITILGAPAFLIADRLLEQAGRPGLGVFDIAPIGLSLTAGGIAMILLIGRLLLPDRKSSVQEEEQFRLDGYYTELVVKPEAGLIGKTIADLERSEDWEIRIVNWMRSGRNRSKPYGRKTIKAGDVMLARIGPEDLAMIREAPGLALHPAVEYAGRFEDAGVTGGEYENRRPGDQLIQAVIGPGSDPIGRTIGEVDFLSLYGVLVVGIWRRRGWLRTRLSRVQLRAGDVLVLQGSPEAFSAIRKSSAFLLLVPFQQEGYRRHKATLAAAIMIGTVAVAAFNLIPIDIALLAGAVAVVLTGCLTVQQAYRSIDSRIYVFIAGAIPLGLAMVETGLSGRLAGWLETLVGGWPTAGILLLLFTFSALATQFMSDAGTTVLLGPVAISLAIALGEPPEGFLVTVAVAAVASFLTPIGHHGNLLIYGPGGYKFSDFLRAGIPLTLLTAVIVIILAPRLWPG
jgi:di/tricarboxylate transporter